MSKLRNPFRMRASEKIISDANFLGMYSPSVLDMLLSANKTNELWDYVTYIHSSPGGGKTSLLRLFEPSVLNSLVASQNYNRDVFNSLKKLDVIDENRARVLGVYLLCSRSFEALEDINEKPGSQKRLLFALMNARIILAALKGVLSLKNKKFPDDLEHITFNNGRLYEYFLCLNTSVPKNGQELYNWAANTEADIFSALDSLVPIEQSKLPGHDELFAFKIIAPDNLYYDNGSICERVLFMLDDAHVLTNRQRTILRDEIVAKRNNNTIWIAERIEALTSDDLLDRRNVKSRDWKTLNLEEYFRGREHRNLFSTIAEKRAALSTSNVMSFQDHLLKTIDESAFQDQYAKSINDSKENLNAIQKTTNKYDNWITYADTITSNYEERAILFKIAEILIGRDYRKRQLSLDFGSPIEETDGFKDNAIRNAAIYFISKEYHIPYYYGFEDLARMSSYNIEQFLSFASELFENMISNHILGNSVALNSSDQERIIKQVAKGKWLALNHSTPYSPQIIRFLSNMAKFCKNETNQINAPYAPGVNGFGIKDSSVNLFDNKHWTMQEQYEPLVNIISTCVAFNLLEIKQTNQGVKNQTWNVYYFNRWLCVYFDLPLSYGNWRPQTPNQLTKWLE